MSDRVERQVDIQAQNGMIIDYFPSHRLYIVWILKYENE